MPESDTDPDKFTIDEMLLRLKGRADAGGKLVTRADGTQAVKVRKLRRRTDQSREKLIAQNQRMQLFKIAGFIVVLVAILIIGGILILYANSAGYRNGLISKIELVSGSEPKLYGFRINPVRASATALDMDWSENHVLKRLHAKDIQAKIKPMSFAGKKFHGKELVANSGYLTLSAPASAGKEGLNSSVQTDSLIHFDRYSIGKMNVFFSPEMSWTEMLENIEVSYLPSKGGKGGELRMNYGQVKVNGWPELVLDRCYVQIENDQWDIKSLDLEFPVSQNQRSASNGSIQMSGVINPLEVGATHQFNVKLDSIQISKLLGSIAGELFQGQVITNADETSNVFRFAPGSGKQPVLELNVTNSVKSGLSLSNFEFLAFLAIALEDSWYELPRFDDEVKLLIRRSGELIEMKDIYLEQKARMIVRGSLAQANQVSPLTGKLQIGIPDSILKVTRNSRLEAIFSPVQNDYRWIELEIAGSASDISDNFKEFYHRASMDGVGTQPSGGESKPQDDGVDSFDELIKGRQ